MSDTKKGSIELARWLCEDIAGELEGEAYGSVDVAEILSAEVERLRERMTELEHQNAALEAENAALKAELAEAKKDAERYRWLRARDCVYPAPRYHDDVASCEQIDWDIDKSMAKETNP